MGRPSTRTEFIDYCKRQLGAPVLEINVADEQIEDIVDDAIQYFQERHFDGVAQTYMKYKVTQGDIDRGKGPGSTVVVGLTTSSATAGIGTTEFTINKLGGVAVGDTVSVGAAITSVAIVGIATTVANKIQIGAAHTSPLEILPGTGVTITRVGQGTTIYNMVNGNILVYAGIASAP